MASPTAYNNRDVFSSATLPRRDDRPYNSGDNDPVRSYFTSIVSPNQNTLPIGRIKTECKRPFSQEFSRCEALISLHPLEAAIIKTPSFQRLLSVQQMGYGYTSGAAAEGDFRHSRGMHSYGALRVAAFLADKNKNNLPPNVALALKIAALLHDIGHPPFSHAGENILKQYPEFNNAGRPFDHDDYAIDLILNGDIGDAIREIGKDYGVTPEMITAILLDEHGLGAVVKHLADRYDYLVRDFDGTSFSPLIHERIANVGEYCLSAKILPLYGTEEGKFNPADYKPVLVGEPIAGERSPLFEMLALRQILYQEYSLHPKAQLIQAILNQAIEEAFEAGQFRYLTNRKGEATDFRSLTDAEAIERFLPEARSLFSLTDGRAADEFYQSAGSVTLDQVRDHNFVRSPSFWSGSPTFKGVRAAIREAVPGLEPYDFFFCATQSYSKSLALHVQDSDGKIKLPPQEVCSPSPKDELAFLVVKKTLREDVKEAIFRAFREFMSDHLESGCKLSTREILSYRVNAGLFINLAGTSSSRSLPTGRRPRVSS